MQRFVKLLTISLLFLMATITGYTQDEPETVSQDVTFRSDITLAGTLMLPAGEGPFPALILLTGSGPQDRNNGTAALPGYRPFEQMAAHFAAGGVAVLRFDDRGVGDSEGNITTATPNELVRDAEAALDYLREQASIDAQRIGVLGHSEGGTVATMLAARRDDIQFVVMLAAPAVSGRVLADEAYARMIEQADDPALAAELAEAERIATELALAEEWEALEAHLYQNNLRQFETFVDEGQISADERETLAREQAVQAVNTVYQNPRFRFTMTYDPADDLSQVDVPVLALFAEHDDVVIAEQNMSSLKDALSHNEAVTTEVVSDVNHLFLPAETANPSEWTALSTELSMSLLDRIRQWMLTTGLA